MVMPILYLQQDTHRECYHACMERFPKFMIRVRMDPNGPWTQMCEMSRKGPRPKWGQQVWGSICLRPSWPNGPRAQWTQVVPGPNVPNVSWARMGPIGSRLNGYVHGFQMQVHVFYVHTNVKGGPCATHRYLHDTHNLMSTTGRSYDQKGCVQHRWDLFYRTSKGLEKKSSRVRNDLSLFAIV